MKQDTKEHRSGRNQLKKTQEIKDSDKKAQINTSFKMHKSPGYNYKNTENFTAEKYKQTENNQTHRLGYSRTNMDSCIHHTSSTKDGCDYRPVLNLS